MKSTLLFLAGLLLSSSLSAQVPQQKLYLNLNSHNETADPRYDSTNNINYMNFYPYIKRLADSVISKKVAWNYQSEVSFLLGAIKWDPKSLSNSISGSNLNLVKWMDDSQFIECDPHTHEGTWPPFGTKKMNYADDAHLHDSLGVTNRKNVGGFKCDGLQNGSDWQDFENGMACATYTTAPKWKPNVLWGGSKSAGVHNDLNSYGAWKPQSRTNFSTHVNTNRVRTIGNGCELHFTDTTVDSRITTNLRDYATKVSNGTWTVGTFYTQTIQIDQRDFKKTNFITRVCAILDTANRLVAEGKAIWCTLSQKDSIWMHVLDSMAFINDCNTVTASAGINNFSQYNNFEIYPNPASDIVFVKASSYDKINVKISNAVGQEIKSLQLNGSSDYQLDVNYLSEGIYFMLITDESGKSSNHKLIISK